MTIFLVNRLNDISVSNTDITHMLLNKLPEKPNRFRKASALQSAFSIRSITKLALLNEKPMDCIYFAIDHMRRIINKSPDFINITLGEYLADVSPSGQECK